jgi:hypothetical protein
MSQTVNLAALSILNQRDLGNFYTVMDTSSATGCQKVNYLISDFVYAINQTLSNATTLTTLNVVRTNDTSIQNNTGDKLCYGALNTQLIVIIQLILVPNTYERKLPSMDCMVDCIILLDIYSLRISHNFISL